MDMATNARGLWYLRNLALPGLAAVAAVVAVGDVNDQVPQTHQAAAPRDVVPRDVVPRAGARLDGVVPAAAVLQPVAFQQAEDEGGDDAAGSTRNTVPVFDAQILLTKGHESLLATDRPGVIGLVKPTEGDHVEKGDLLVELRAEEAKAQLAVARQEASTDVNERFARAQLDVSQAELDKALSANRKYPNAVSQVELDRLEFTRDRADLQIEQAIQEREVATLRVGEALARVDASEIRAPFSGYVTRVLKNVGEAVRQGDPLIQLRNTSRVKVEGYVSVAQAQRLKRGLPVEVHLDSPEALYEPKPHKGTLHFVDVAVDPVNGRVRVWAEVENPDNELRAGLTARMYIELPEGTPPAPADQPPPGKPTI
jgi:RND family efflux transporter MFP subunit